MSDEKILETLVKKVDGLADDARSNSFKLDRLENMIDGLTSNVKTLSGQFSDVGIMAIDDHKRVGKLEERVGVLEAEVH